MDGAVFRCTGFLMNSPEGMFIDHINGNGLDNRKCNLRICTNTQNQYNASIRKDNTSGFRGVCWNRGSNKWQAYMRVNGKQTSLGLFTCLIKAAKTYDEAAKKYHKDFANLNFKEIL